MIYTIKTTNDPCQWDASSCLHFSLYSHRLCPIFSFTFCRLFLTLFCHISSPNYVSQSVFCMLYRVSVLFCFVCFGRFFLCLFHSFINLFCFIFDLIKKVLFNHPAAERYIEWGCISALTVAFEWNRKLIFSMYSFSIHMRLVSREKNIAFNGNVASFFIGSMDIFNRIITG